MCLMVPMQAALCAVRACASTTVGMHGAVCRAPTQGGSYRTLCGLYLVPTTHAHQYTVR